MLIFSRNACWHFSFESFSLLFLVSINKPFSATWLIDFIPSFFSPRTFTEIESLMKINTRFHMLNGKIWNTIINGIFQKSHTPNISYPSGFNRSCITNMMFCVFSRNWKLLWGKEYVFFLFNALAMPSLNGFCECTLVITQSLNIITWLIRTMIFGWIPRKLVSMIKCWNSKISMHIFKQINIFA